MSSLTKAAERREDASLPPKEDRLEFTALSQRFYFTPSRALRTPHDPASPKLILLFGWLGARLRHVQKYATGYHQLYPSSPIIIVRSFHSDLRPFSKFAQEFHSLTVLLQLHDVDLTKAGNRVLIQSFSNGGCWSTSALINKLPSSGILRPQTMIFDSCPGRARYSVFIRAFIHAGNLTFLGKLVYTPVITLVYFLYKFLCRIRGKDPFGERRREMLHHIRSNVRVYIYSKEDRLISYNDILTHAKQVRDYYQGHDTVICEEFIGSDHVAHLRLDQNRYWNIVQDAWDPKRTMGHISLAASDVSVSDEEGDCPSSPDTEAKQVLDAEVRAVQSSIGIA